MKAFKRIFLLYMAAGLLITIGCASAGTERETSQTQTLYQRLGGLPAITAVVDLFVAHVGEDSRINQRFATTDFNRLKDHLVDQICEAAGGPCTYTGRRMEATHAGMQISHEEFDALVEDLAAALDDFNVPDQEQKELLSLLAPMRKDIVEVP